MQRRTFLKNSALLASIPLFAPLSGCGYLRIDKMNVLIRSDIITSAEEEKRILAKAKVEWTSDNKIRVLYVQGTPYEMGYQHGVLLRKEIHNNIAYLYDQALSKFHFEELFAECYERMAPFIPQTYLDEMHGLAHGSKLPLHIIHGIHALPEIGEWGGKKQIGKIVKRMMTEDLGTSCSNMSMQNTATADGKMYTVRILDWGLHRISRLHKYPLILVAKPDNGIAYANIGWIGFLGAISGMNAQGITLGEMGYGDPAGETLRGLPMPFLLREVLNKASSLADVRRIISTSPGTNSFAYLMSDGKAKAAELYIRDKSRFVVFSANQDIKDGKANFPAIKDIVYGGHFSDRLNQDLSSNHTKITPELLMKQIIPNVAMKSNFQNVIYSPEDLKFWVSNATSKDDRAAEQTYTFFDLAEALKKY